MPPLTISSLSDVIKNKRFFITHLRRKFGMNRDLAEDIFSDTIEKLLKHNMTPEKMNVGFIVHAMSTVAIDYYRQRRIHFVEELAEVTMGTLTNTTVYQFPTYKKLRKYIYKLNDIQRDMLILKYGYNMTSLEIANLLHLQHETVRARIWRAHNNLRILIKHYTQLV